jgi:hypothetical protein
MATTREVKESPLNQGADEIIAYQVTTTPWVSTPASPTVVAYDITDNARTDVSTTVLSGAASVSGDVITCPQLKSLTAGNVYRVEVKWTSGGNTWECFFNVQAEY